MNNKIKNAIRTIPDFPIKGIMFRDVTTLYSNSEAMKEVEEPNDNTKMIT